MIIEGDYNENGYVVIREFFNNNEIIELASHVDKVYESWLEKNKTEILNTSLVNMHSLTHQEYFTNSYPDDASNDRIELFNAITPSKLIDLMDEMFREEIYLHNTQLFFNPLNSKKRPYWHRDMQFSPAPDHIQKDELHNMLSLHIRIPLENEKGLEIITGTHKRWDTELENKVRFELDGHNSNECLPNAKRIDLNAGDIIIFHAQMIHRGNYDLNGSRKALDLCVGSSHYLTLPYLDKNILPTLKEQDQIKNKKWFESARSLLK